MHFKRVATVLQLHLISLTTTGKVLRRSISTETKYYCKLQLSTSLLCKIKISEKKPKQMSKVLVPAHFTHSPLPTHYARPISEPSIVYRNIGTEGALKRPMTYDNDPSIHPIPSHPQSIFNRLDRPRIDLSRPPMN